MALGYSKNWKAIDVVGTPLKLVIFQLDNYHLSPFSRNLFNLAPELQKRGAEITLLTTSALGMNELPAGVRGHVLASWLPRWVTLPRHYLAVFELINWLRAHNPHTVIARGIPFGVVLNFARSFVSHRFKLITSLHSSISGDIDSRTHRSWWAFKYLARYIVKRSDHTVAVSLGVKQDYLKVLGLCADSIMVIHNPVVTEALTVASKENLSEEWLTLSRSWKSIVNVGRFVPEKDHATLIKALAIIRKTQDVRLLLVGDGVLRHQIERQINDLGLTEKVRLLGRLENPFAYMARADAFVLSSKYEGLPGVLIQAMAVGCPVCSTDCEVGAREILGDGHYGPLTPVGDEVSLANSILHVLSKPISKDLLVKRAAEFSADKSAQAYMNLILES